MSEDEKLSVVTQWLARSVPSEDVVAAVVWDRVSRWVTAYREYGDGYVIDLDCAYVLVSRFEQERKGR